MSSEQTISGVAGHGDRPAGVVPKPRPVPDERSEGYWRAAAQGQLTIQRCEVCGRYSHPPAPVCTGCLTVPPAFVFAPMSGRGKVVSWTVFRRTFLPGFREEVPYVIVMVELAEQPGLHLLGRLVDGADAPVSAGAPVEVVFDQLAPDIAVPAFALAERRP